MPVRESATKWHLLGNTCRPLTGGVVAAVLHPLETLQQDIDDLLAALGDDAISELKTRRDHVVPNRYLDPPEYRPRRLSLKGVPITSTWWRTLLCHVALARLMVVTE
uniref:WS_DGAT_C domain-containing protein n=1 Tax=Steinernema glaseri TaxID=37863 RepID=A0A1I7ZL68_9BILA